MEEVTARIERRCFISSVLDRELGEMVKFLSDIVNLAVPDQAEIIKNASLLRELIQIHGDRLVGSIISDEEETNREEAMNY